MGKTIDIKGVGSGIIIEMARDAKIEDIVRELSERLSGSDFYLQAKVVGTKGKELSYAEKALIDELLIKLTGNRSESLEEYDEKAKKGYIERKVREEVLAEYQKIINEEMVPKLEKLQAELDIEREKNLEKRGNMLFHEGTLRSGASLNYDGTIVILGDINAGAEVVATGNIICLGKALGLVHAGAKGDESSFVFALSLAPTQIRIARYVSGPAGGKKYKPKGVPEMAKLVKDRIVLEEV